MGHLSTETLARLVDEPPRGQEAKHLAECRLCATELDALRAQTRALAALLAPQGSMSDLDVERLVRTDPLERESELDLRHRHCCSIHRACPDG